METFNYDSYCGIYCGACDIIMAYKTGSKYKLASFWNESTVKRFQKNLGLKYDKPYSLKCNGCKSDTQFVNCAVCGIRTCAIDKKIDHCINCKEYPCKLIVGFNKIKSLLPHLESKQPNMERINAVGINSWLIEQENKWKCPKCNSAFSWYTNKCKNCGADLKKYNYKFTFLQSIILKLAIYMAPKQK